MKRCCDIASGPRGAFGDPSQGLLGPSPGRPWHLPRGSWSLQGPFEGCPKAFPRPPTAFLRRLQAVHRQLGRSAPVHVLWENVTGTSREDLNGRTGTAPSFDHARRRYVVELDGNSETQKHKLKPENLAPCTGRTGGKKKKTMKTTKSKTGTT